MTKLMQPYESNRPRPPAQVAWIKQSCRTGREANANLGSTRIASDDPPSDAIIRAITSIKRGENLELSGEGAHEKCNLTDAINELRNGQTNIAA
jgi:hypothetical protein